MTYVNTMLPSESFLKLHQPSDHNLAVTLLMIS